MNTSEFVKKVLDAHTKAETDIEHLEITVTAIAGCIKSLVKNVPEYSVEFNAIRERLLAELKLLKND